MIFKVFTAVSVKIMVWLRCDTLEFGRQVLNCCCHIPEDHPLMGHIMFLLLLEFPVVHKKFVNHGCYFIKLLHESF